MTTPDFGTPGADHGHEPWRTAAAAYALDALDRDECAAFVAHLATCAECRAEVASFHRVAEGLALAVDRVAPPETLKSRTLDRALGGLAPASAPTIPRTPPPSWWLVAAAAVAALGLGIYALSLRSQIGSLEGILADSAGHERALRAELEQARRDSAARATRVMDILTAPDLLRVDLGGQGPAASATGRAFWSPVRGLVFDAQGLPPLDRGRVYQLWVLVPAPVSAGVLTPDASGAMSMATGLPAGVGAVSAVAVTNEPGPGGSATPTLPILLVGKIRTSASN